MNKNIKSCFIFVLSLCLMVTATNFSVLASESNVFKNFDVNIYESRDLPQIPVAQMNAEDKAVAIDVMKQCGLTDNQIQRLINIENNNYMANSISTRGNWVFPPNPQIGDQFERKFFLSKGTLIAGGAGVAEISAVIAGAGVPLLVAITAAGWVAQAIGDNVDFEGLDFVTHYVYGETNEGTLGWNTGATEWTVKKKS